MAKKTAPVTSGSQFDALAYLKQVNASDHLRVVLAAHLYIEAVLGELIERVLPYPDALKLGGRRFDERLRLASALGILHPR